MSKTGLVLDLRELAPRQGRLLSCLYLGLWRMTSVGYTIIRCPLQVYFNVKPTTFKWISKVETHS